MKRSVLLFFLIFSLSGNAFSLAPKFGIRTSNGLISAQVDDKKQSSIVLLGLEPQAMLFFTPEMAVGIDYSIHLDYSTSHSILSGGDAFYRYYFYNFGTTVREEDSGGSFSSASPVSGYVAGYLGYWSYTPRFEEVATPTTPATPAPTTTPATSTTTETGNAVTLKFGVGLDYRLRERWDANAEAVFDLLNFTGSANTPRVQTFLVKLGLHYIF